MFAKLVLVLGIGFFGPTAHALEGEEATHATNKFCWSFQGSAMSACLEAFDGVRYIDPEALQTCRALETLDSIAKCLPVIKDRVFWEGELKACHPKKFAGDRYLEARVLHCLQESSRAYSGTNAPKASAAPDSSLLRSNLAKALELLKKGDTRGAESILEATLDGLKE